VDGVLRLVGPYYSPNHTALYLVRIFFVGLGIALAAGGNWARLAGFSASLVVLIALALTVSRGAWLLGIPAGVAFCVLWWMVKQDKIFLARRTRMILLPALVVTLSGALLLTGSRLTNSATIASRWSIWRDTWQLWLDHWLVGVGPGGFFWRYPAYLTQFTNEPNILHPHNVWLEVAATWGAVGWLWLLALLAFVIHVVQQLRLLAHKRESWLVAGALAGLAAAFAHAQVDSFLLLPDLAAWNWLVLGLLANAKRSWLHQDPYV
jgi:O-antigen ligase